MVSEKETLSIRRFVCGQLRDELDLSTLTLRILKRRYLAHAQCEALSPEARRFMKKVVQEELMKMQDIDKNGSELKTKKLLNKRKREKENDEVIRRVEDESIAKKSRYQSRSSSEDYKTAHEENEEEEQIKSGSEDEEREMNKSQQETNGNSKKQINSEDSTDEEGNESEKEGNERNCSNSPKEKVKNKGSSTKNGEKSANTSRGKETTQSAEESDSDTDDKSGRSDKIKGSDSSDDSDKEKASVEKQNNDPDADSSSLSSLEDEQDREKENLQDDKKKKKEKSAKGQKYDDKAVVRLKRYIALCGVRRNYKKLLDGCSSVRSQVAVLKKELKDLGVRGQPSMEKCKKVRMKREEAQELAELDVSNIIATQGRPKRRGASAWHEQQEPPSSTYVRTLNSGSDSDQEIDTHRRRKRATDWANLQGIISDDANSD